MIENEIEYQEACQLLDRLMEALEEAMLLGRSPDIDPILWQISWQSIQRQAMRLEAELRKYNDRISRLGGDRL